MRDDALIDTLYAHEMVDPGRWSALLEQLRALEGDVYLTIDIDGFDPSIAPGTGTPSHGGFLYYEVLELLAGLAAQGHIVGIDLVEVAPDYDRTGTTAILAAQLLLHFRVHDARLVVEHSAPGRRLGGQHLAGHVQAGLAGGRIFDHL